MRATGFVFVVATVIPILGGIHIGAHFDHTMLGGVAGAVVGFALGVWLSVRPVWKDADRDDGQRRDE